VLSAEEDVFESAAGFCSGVAESLVPAVFSVLLSQHESADPLEAFFSLFVPSVPLAGRTAAREINTVKTISFISSGVPKTALSKLVNFDSARIFNGFSKEFFIQKG